MTEIVETDAGRVSVERFGAGPDLVMLHSLLTDRHVYDRIVPLLAVDHRVTLVDLPGFGESSPVAGTMDAAADLVGSLLSDGVYHPATTTLLGNGLGGFVALGTAIRHGDRFNKLILAGAGATFPDDARPAFATMRDKVAAGGMAAVVDQALGRIFSPAYADSHPDMIQERRDVLLATPPDAFMAACQALETLDYENAVAAVTNPTLLVVGSEDWPTPPAMGRQLADAMPNCRYVELAGIGHAPQLQDPEGFVAAIRPFLDE